MSAAPNGSIKEIADWLVSGIAKSYGVTDVNKEHLQRVCMTETNVTKRRLLTLAMRMMEDEEELEMKITMLLMVQAMLDGGLANSTELKNMLFWASHNE